jgi:RecA-family ATPase
VSARPSNFTLTDPSKPLRLYSTAELLRLPPPSWLVDKVVPSGGLIGLYGPPGAGKSFVALDIALSVATGDAWQGHNVQRGYVVYVSAEGGTGIGKRVLAWLQTHNLSPEEAHIAWLIESIPVHTDSEQMAKLLNRIVDELEVEPSLVVVDTLARCFDGDENQQEDMGRFIAGVDVLRHDLRTAVLIVHHTRLGGDRERGNTAFRGAADTMLSLTSDGQDITIVCDKQKDAEEHEAIYLKRIAVEGTDSCVILDPKVVLVQAKTQRIDKFLSILREVGALSADAWISVSELSRPTAYRYIKELTENGKITKENGKFWATSPS